MVLAQYYNLVRYGRPGYTYVMRNMQTNAHLLADKLEDIGRFQLIGRDQEQLPLAAFKLADRDLGYDEFDIAWQLSAERGWMVPAYTLPPNAQNETIMRALVKETLSREHIDTLARDIDAACTTLSRKGRATTPNAKRSSPVQDIDEYATGRRLRAAAVSRRHRRGSRIGHAHGPERSGIWVANMWDQWSRAHRVDRPTPSRGRIWSRRGDLNP